MNSSLSLPVIIVFIHVSDAYLRYISFQKNMTEAEKRIFWRRIFMWSVLASILYAFVLNSGVSPSAYKLILMLGWIPYLAIFMISVKRDIWPHLFVFGMSALWSFSQHNWSSIVVVDVLKLTGTDFLLTFHAALYLVWFVILFPVERRCFSKLLAASQFFSGKTFGRYIALLPLIVLFGPILLISDDELIHSFDERISRLFLPAIFFFFYYNAIVIAKYIYERLRVEQYNNRLKTQISFLERYQAMTEQNQETLSILRHDMKHSYRLLYSMLSTGKIEDAMEYIKKQGERVENTSLYPYCKLPLINAALSVYFSQAEKIGAKISYKIDLPPKINTEVDDLAALVSNLLENAVRAESKQDEEKREISLFLRYMKGQIVLEISNYFIEPLNIGENGLPISKELGHGIGMLSLLSFAKKYGAYFDFSHDNGYVKVIMYWKDYGKIKNEPK